MWMAKHRIDAERQNSETNSIAISVAEEVAVSELFLGESKSPRPKSKSMNPVNTVAPTGLLKDPPL